ncbi:MAG TPA: geranylgeranyl reductase family protein [Dehalococcoidia bacterium]|nr:geranylgeranyl reductase family protein [Dehalococcoidia bacterium]
MTNNTRSEFDAIVVGGGPAGSTAARRLAQAGARTLLLDKSEHPRYKTCGGGVPARTVALLDVSIESVLEGEVSAIEVTHFGKGSFVKQAGSPIAYMVMRDRFDDLLLHAAEEAGAEVHQAEAVTALERHRGASILRTARGSYTAPFLLAADGATGPIARWSGLGKGIATSAAYEIEIDAPAAALDRWEGRANIDVGYKPWGYGWAFPKQGRLSVGVVVSPGHGNSIRRWSQEYLARLGLDGARVGSSTGHPIRYRRSDQDRIAQGPVLLLGDAAGLADEFTAEGIAYAVHSGILSADAVIGALNTDGTSSPTDAARAYERAVNREVQPELNAARAISRMYYWCVTTWARLALSVSQRVDYFWRAFFRIMRGEARYDTELGRWPGLAWTPKVL